MTIQNSNQTTNANNDSVRLTKGVNLNKATDLHPVYQPLDYAPRFRELDARRQARKDKWLNRATLALITLLMWTVIFFAMAGVYFYRTDGLSQAWLPLSVAFGSLTLLLGAWCTSSRVRRVFRQEV